jgi:hypothetical protein
MKYMVLRDNLKSVSAALIWGYVRNVLSVVVSWKLKAVVPYANRVVSPNAVNFRSLVFVSPF